VTPQAGKRAGRAVTHLCAEAVGHEVKGTVGRDEGDRAVVLEAREPDAPARHIRAQAPTRAASGQECTQRRTRSQLLQAT